MIPAKIIAIEKKIDRILFYLEDDLPTGKKGVVSTINAHGKRIERLEKENLVGNAKVSTLNAHGKRIEKLEEGNLVSKAKVAGLSAGIGGIAGATIGKIWAWLSHVIF